VAWTSAVAPTPSRRRWPLIVGALVVVVVVAIAGAVGWWFRAGTDYWARAHWQPPNEALLSSMKVHPVPGWKADINALGLPPGSKITTDDTPWRPGPIIKTPDDRALFLARSPGPDAPQWWLTGVDVRDGHPLFRPVALNASAAAPACFLNGAAVTCISEDQTAATAWVIDGQNGELTYSGPTNVHVITNKLRAAQFGNYLVAVTKGDGLYGVGPHGETTWFVPGAGVVADHIGDVGFQGGSREGVVTMFSLQDGRELTTEFPEGADMQSSGDFDGGFAAEFSEHQGPSFIQFFDTVGRLTNKERIDGQRVGGTTGNVTAIVQEDGFGVYGPSGDELLDVSGDAPHGMQLIGTTLWVGEKSLIDESHFQPYDLRTGDKGKPCGFNMINGYLGTDGSVFVRSSWNEKSDDLAQAYDLATCDKVWSIPRTVGSSGEVTRIGDTLVQLSNDGTELMSLVAPS
jgi:hypothetical protein